MRRSCFAVLVTHRVLALVEDFLRNKCSASVISRCASWLAERNVLRQDMGKFLEHVLEHVMCDLRHVAPANTDILTAVLC